MGCTKVSAGCDNCYMYREQRQYGNDPDVVRRSKTKFSEPLKWKDGRLVFTCSWSDWFHVDADSWRDEAWDVIRRSPQHTFQILTKRPGRILRHLPDDWGDGYANVWLGTSVESNEFLSRVRVLRDVPAALRFISAEPLLGPLPDLDLDGIGWVIVGGESGTPSTSRPMHPNWAREIRDTCREHDVPFHFKQWGSWRATYTASVVPAGHVHHFPDGQAMVYAGATPKSAGKLLDGHEWCEIPERSQPESQLVLA